MEKFTHLKTQQTIPQKLELMFVTEVLQPKIPQNNSGRLISKHQVSNVDESQQNISSTISAFRYHYIKDIIQNFPDVYLENLMMCPQNIPKNCQMLTGPQYRIICAQGKRKMDEFYPIFYNANKKEQYFQEKKEQIGIILQYENIEEGFYGYVPESCNVYLMFEAFAKFFDLEPESFNAFMTQIGGEYVDISRLKQKTVKQMANCYVKVAKANLQSHQYSTIIIQPNLHRNQYQNDLLNMQSVATNLANSIYSEMEVQTCFEASMELRKKLINLKSNEQVEKIKRKCKIFQATIGIPEASETQMESRLFAISQQISKMID